RFKRGCDRLPSHATNLLRKPLRCQLRTRGVAESCERSGRGHYKENTLAVIADVRLIEGSDIRDHLKVVKPRRHFRLEDGVNAWPDNDEIRPAPGNDNLCLDPAVALGPIKLQLARFA